MSVFNSLVGWVRLLEASVLRLEDVHGILKCKCVYSRDSEHLMSCIFIAWKVDRISSPLNEGQNRTCATYGQLAVKIDGATNAQVGAQPVPGPGLWSFLDARHVARDEQRGLQFIVKKTLDVYQFVPSCLVSELSSDQKLELVRLACAVRYEESDRVTRGSARPTCSAFARVPLLLGFQ